jgi:hypothetical protein
LTFLLSGLPSKEDVDELTETLEAHGGIVRRDVPPPDLRVFSRHASEAYQPSQDVGAPVVNGRRDSPGRNTRVVTPHFGRTLKCLYAAAVGAPLVSPEWVRASADAGKALALKKYRVTRPSKHPRARSEDDDDDDDDEDDEDEDDDEDAPLGNVFDGVVVSLSGDANYVRQFGVLLRHAGADVIAMTDLISAEGEDVPMGEGPCDYALVQTVVDPRERKGKTIGRKVDGVLSRASRRLGVPCVRHEWAVDSLLANALLPVDETYVVPT